MITFNLFIIRPQKLRIIITVISHSQTAIFLFTFGRETSWSLSQIPNQGSVTYADHTWTLKLRFAMLTVNPLPVVLIAMASLYSTRRRWSHFVQRVSKFSMRSLIRFAYRVYYGGPHVSIVFMAILAANTGILLVCNYNRVVLWPLSKFTYQLPGTCMRALECIPLSMLNSLPSATNS